MRSCYPMSLRASSMNMIGITGQLLRCSCEGLDPTVYARNLCTLNKWSLTMKYGAICLLFATTLLRHHLKSSFTIEYGAQSEK